MRADVALIGFGHVARRFAELLDERRASLLEVEDLDVRIVGIATLRHGSAFAAAGLRGLTDAAPGTEQLTPSAIIERLAGSDAPLRVMVEATTLSIRDGQPATSHVEAAIDRGCDVVTANKGPVAFAYARLRDRAAAAGRSFLFEGAVMDGVPIFNLVRETMPELTFAGFRGVVNSTTNHILSALEDGEPFEPALARMQADGIAEADPSLDIDGWDAAAKAAALANVLLGASLTPHDVDRHGIGPDTAPAAIDARRRGCRLKLVVSGERRTDGLVQARVGLTEVPESDLLAGLRGTANGLVLHTDLLGDVAISQLGGGVTMTAYALLSDLITIRRRARQSQ